MGLKELYKIAAVLNNEIKKEMLPKETRDCVEITLYVPPQIHYGIDKEFYYMTHGNTYEGFVHTGELVTATVDGIKFNIEPKKKEEE